MNFRLSLSLALGLVIASPVLGQTITNSLAAMDGNFKSISSSAQTVEGSNGIDNLAPLEAIRLQILAAQDQLNNLPSSLNLLDLLLNSAAYGSQLKTTVDSHQDAFEQLSEAFTWKIGRYSFEAFFDVPLANQILLSATDNELQMIGRITIPFQTLLNGWSNSPLVDLFSISSDINQSRQSLLSSIQKSVEPLCAAYTYSDSRLDPQIKIKAESALRQIGTELGKIISKQTCQGTYCDSTLIPLATQIRNNIVCLTLITA